MEHVYVICVPVCVCEIVIAAGLIHEAYVTIIMRLVNGPWLINKFYTEGRTKIENKEQRTKSTKQKHKKQNTGPKYKTKRKRNRSL